MPSAALSIPRPRAAGGSGRPGQRLPLEGVLNLRDLGGYRAAGGRSVAAGQLFRADALGQATEHDVETLGRLGIRRVCDLRSDEEVARLPDRLPSGVAYERSPMLVHPNVLADYNAPDFDWDDYRLERMYIDMLDRCGETFCHIFARLARPNSYPFVFHCSGGKDRTGIVAALLLRVLGVADAAIVADYALSERYIRPKVADFRARLQREGRNPRGAARLFHSPPEAMVSALAHLDERYGTTERYLTAIGVPAPQILRFQRTMLG